jgi:hypothetical protein
LKAAAKWDAQAGGVMLGLYVYAVDVPRGTMISFNGAVSAGGRLGVLMSQAIQSGLSRGLSDFFGLGAMAEGWGTAAWAAKGLPATGNLCLQLHVTSVNPGDAPPAIGSGNGAERGARLLWRCGSVSRPGLLPGWSVGGLCRLV